MVTRYNVFFQYLCTEKQPETKGLFIQKGATSLPLYYEHFILLFYCFLFCFVLFRIFVFVVVVVVLITCIIITLIYRSSRSQIFYKIGVFKNLARKTLAQVLSYEFCKIFKDIFYRPSPDSFISVRKKIASAFAFQKSNMLTFRSMFLCRKILVHITKIRHT